ncbi:MAG TPA: lipopolysaccharide assembly protein LapA domain-containing protein [Candidatus Krumholzibacteria bacterium]|nr:lipopolysaccharide assembly protein LapA domain-containing protein [Candidatus Krumholzibacteria bacterium]
MRQVRTFFLILLGLVLVIVMVQNARPIEFRFLNWTYQVSQLLLVALVLVIGFLGGFITAKLTGRAKDRV